MSHQTKRRIQHKRSSVAGAKPSAGQLVPGEMTINFADRYIYTLDNTGQVLRLNGHCAIGMPASLVGEGDAYVDPLTGKFYVYYARTGSGGPTWNEVAPPENLAQLLPLSGGGMLGPLHVVEPAVGDELIGHDQALDLVVDGFADHVRADGLTLMTGPLLLFSAPASANQAATKKYVDDAAATAAPVLTAYLPRTGGTMTGQITLPGGSTGNQAVTVNEQRAAIISHEATLNPHPPYTLDSELAAHIAEGKDQHPKATPSVAGFMDHVDKTRLDGIVRASTAEITAGTNNTKFITSLDLKTEVEANVPVRTRPKLFANRTYFVRSNGNDDNDGLTDTATGAFLTWQAAIFVAAGLDFNGFTVTIKCTQQNVVFTQGAFVPKMMGVTSPGNLLIQCTTIGVNPIIQTSQSYGFRVEGKCRISGFKFKVSAAVGDSIALCAINCGVIEQFDNFFDTQTGQPGYLSAHMLAANGGQIYTTDDYQITGDAVNHMIAHNRGFLTTVANDVDCHGRNFTIFAIASMQGVIDHRSAVNWFNKGGGQQYSAAAKGVINNNNTFPGPTNGVTSSGGLYL